MFVPLLAPHYELRVTDVNPLPFAFAGEFRQVDIAAPDQVMAAAEGIDSDYQSRCVAARSPVGV